MKRRIETSVFRITSRRPEKDFKNLHGTGFLFYRDDDFDYILTCRHVIRDLGGAGHVNVDARKPEDVVLLSEKGPDDLAIIKVATGKLSKAPVLELCPAQAPDREILIIGYFKLPIRDFKLSKEPVRSRLNGYSGHAQGPEPGDAKVWKLEITGKNKLQVGYSGSPAVDKETGKVIGVVNMKIGDGAQGYAVSIETLLERWRDIPESLRQALKSVEGKPKRPPAFESEPDGSDKTCILNINSKLCNREEQVSCFLKFFKERQEPSYRNRPQFYIVHGFENDCPWSLVERFKYELTTSLKKDVLKPFKVRPKNLFSSSGDNRDIIADLFECVKEREVSVQEKNIDALCALPNIVQHPIVMICHTFSTDEWHSHYAALFSGYFNQFWSDAFDYMDQPLFLVFLNIEHKPVTEKGWLKRFSAHRKIAAVERQLKKIAASVENTCLIPEMKPVTINQVYDWYGQHISNKTNEDETWWRSKIKSLFNDLNKKDETGNSGKEVTDKSDEDLTMISMWDTELLLIPKIIETLDQKYFKIHTG